MAYQTTIIREARRCGGAGWKGYDSMFRQHAANLPNIDWSKVNNSLFAFTFMAQQNGRGKTYELCLEPDHVAAECALALRSQVNRHRRANLRDWEACQQASAVLAPAGNGGPGRNTMDRVARQPTDPQGTGRSECATPGMTAHAGSSTAGTGMSVTVVGASTGRAP